MDKVVNLQDWKNKKTELQHPEECGDSKDTPKNLAARIEKIQSSIKRIQEIMDEIRRQR